MNEQLILEIGKNAIETVALVSSPMLLGALAIGLVISVMQAITQINEATLTFIPKIVVVLIVLLIAAPWMLDVLGKFTVGLYENLPEYVRN